MTSMTSSALTYSRLAVVEVAALVAVGVLAGVGPSFPRGVAAATAWTFLTADAVAVAHALLGALVLAVGTIMVLTAPRKFVPAPVFLGAGLSVVSGVWCVRGHQPVYALRR